MKEWQKAVKYVALGLAIFLSVSIIGGILSAVAAFGGIFDFFNGNKNLVGDSKSYSVSNDISALDIEIGAAELNIKIGDKFDIESNLKDLKVQEKNGKLIISQKERWFNISSEAAVLNIYIPENTEFKTADIATGAGKVTIQKLQAEEIDLELGAGAVIIENLISRRSADIDGGAGALTIEGGEIYNLDLTMGVGDLKLTGKLLGEADLDYGIGKTELNLIGNDYYDYSVILNKGIGKTTINGSTVSDGTVFGKGKTKIEIDGGIGENAILFLESAE